MNMRNIMSLLLAFLLVFSGMMFFAQEAEATELVSLDSLTRGQVVTLKRENGTTVGTAMVVTPGATPYLVMIGNHFGHTAWSTWDEDTVPTTARSNATNWLNTNNPGYMTVSNENSVPSKVQMETLTQTQRVVIAGMDGTLQDRCYWTSTYHGPGTHWPANPSKFAHVIVETGEFALGGVTSSWSFRPAFHLKAGTPVTSGSIVLNPVSFSNLTALNGVDSSIATTELRLTFDVAPTNFTTANITVTGATKGSLTGSGTTYTLAISNITVANGANVTVTLTNPTPLGIHISPASRDVQVWKDTTAPSVPSVSWEDGSDNVWSNSNTTLTASSSDNAGGSGLSKIEKSVDGGAWVELTTGESGSHTYTGNGTQTIRFRAIDNAGNISAETATYTINVDKSTPTAPTATVTSGTHNVWSNTDTTVTASGGAPGASGHQRYEMRTKPAGGSWSSWTTGHTYTQSTDGETDVEFRVVNNANTAGASSAVVTLKVDKSTPTAPTATVTGGTHDVWSNTDTTVTASGGTPGASGHNRYEMRTRPAGGSWSSWSTASSYTQSTSGATGVAFRVVNNAGTPGTASAERILRVDKVIPGISAISTNTEWTNAASVPVTIANPAEPGLSGLDRVEYKLEGATVADWQIYSSSFNINNAGETTIRSRSFDNAGNQGAESTATVRIDRTAPGQPVIANDTNWTNAAQVPVTITHGIDTGGSLVHRTEYKLEGDTVQDWTVYTSTFNITNIGVTTITAKTYDHAGNVSAERISTVRIDRTAPTGTLTLAADKTVNGINYTRTLAITLNLTRNNTNNGKDPSTVVSMRFANTEAEISSASWESYSDTRAGWSLTSGNGYKTVYFQLKDDAGNLSEVYSKQIALDSNRPVLTISQPSRYMATFNDVVEYIVTFSDNANHFGVPDISFNGGIEHIRIVTDTSLVELIYHGTVDPEKLTVTTGDVAGQPLKKFIRVTVGADASGEGSVGVKVLANAAEDNAGNQSVETLSNFTFSISLTPPNNQDHLFTADLTVRGGSAVQLAATSVATGGHLSDSIRFAPAGYAGAPADGVTITSTHGESAVINAPINEGTYKLYIVDGAGNLSNPSAATLTVKNDGPAVSVTGPDKTHVQAASTVEFVVTFSNDTVPETIGTFFTQTKVGLLTTGTANAYVGIEEITGEPLQRIVILSNLMGEGTIRIRIAGDAARDAIGNPSQESAISALIKVDNTPATLTPVTILSDNSNPAWAKKGDTITLTFTANEEIKQPAVTIGGQTVTATNDLSGFMGDQMKWQAVYTIPGDATLNHLGGLDMPFSIVTEDLAGNVAGVVTAITSGSNVRLDFTTPEVTSDNDNYSWQKSDISVNLTYADGGQVEYKYYKVNQSAAWSDSDWSLYTNTITISTEGSSYVHYKAVDIAGNSQTGTFGPFRLDKTPPTIGGVEDGVTYGIAKTVIHSDDNMASVVLKKFTQVANDYETINNNFASGTEIGENGQYRVIAKDLAGNETTVSFIIELTQAALDAEAAAVTIGYAPGDHAGSVTKNVTLPVTGNQGTLITWSSNHGAIITSGTVTRPEAGTGDETVTLTATLEKDGNLTVKEKPSDAEEAEKAAEDWDNMSIIYAEGDSAASVTQNITLKVKGTPNGSDVTWHSSDHAAVSVGSSVSDDSVTGTVTRPAFTAGDKEVVMTATISRGDPAFEYETKTFTITIKRQAGTVEAEVDEDKENLEIIYAVGDSAARVTQNITLPNSGSNGSTVAWASSKPGIINPINGAVIRQNTNSAVTMTATLEKAGVVRTKTFVLTVVGLSTASELAEADKDAITIGYQSGDSQNHVTQNITLPALGSLYGSSITWSSNNTSVVNSAGAVNRPAYGSGDAVVTLTARVNRPGSPEHTRTFAITIKETPGTDAQKIAKDKKDLNIHYASGDNAASVTKNVGLPKNGSEGSAVTWQSSHSNIAVENSAGSNNLGRVTREVGDITVTLTATLTLGEETATKTFELTVKAQPADLVDQIEEDAENISIGYAPGDSPDHVTQNVTLPTAGANGSTITWVSDQTASINNSGTVTRMGEDKTVTLTARVYKGGQQKYSTRKVNH